MYAKAPVSRRDMPVSLGRARGICRQCHTQVIPLAVHVGVNGILLQTETDSDEDYSNLDSDNCEL
jgi:hypothetical protein